MNAEKRQTGARGVLLAAMVLCIVLVAVSSAQQPALTGSERDASAERVMILDPFELTLVAVSSLQPTISVKSTDSVAFTASTQRPTIRIPPQLPPRSAFHPLML